MRFHNDIILGLGLLCVFEGCKKAPPPPPPPHVQVVTAAAQDVPIYQQWIGSLDGYPNAQIRAQVSGYLIRQDYVEGSAVKKGDLLFEVDPRPFQAALDQTLAKLAQDKAQQGRTQLDVQRYAPLVKEQAISQEEMDDAVQNNLAALAQVKADEALGQTAQLNLSFCRITSPVDGVAGVAQAQIGDLVGPGTAVLTTVSTLDPMRAYFNVSEQTYLQLNRKYTNATERQAHDATIKLQLILSDGMVYSLPGKWFFTGLQVDVTTGTLQVAGLFPNPGNVLRPGQYAQVRAQMDTRHAAILLPQRAVTELQGSYQVAIVDEGKKVHIKTVQVGEQMGNDWLIDKGVAPGDQVVAEGTQRVKEGITVQTEPYHAQ